MTKLVSQPSTVDPQTFDFTRFHYFSEHTSALKIIPLNDRRISRQIRCIFMPIKVTLM